MRLIDADALKAKISASSLSSHARHYAKHMIDESPTIEAEPVQHWIPCAERLPEVYEKVLTYSDEGIIHDNFRLNLRDGSIGWSQGWVVTHWQPRPEPPEGGAGNAV